MRCVKPSSATLSPSCTCVAIASLSGSTGMASVDHGLRLLAQVLRQVVEGGDRLAGGARALPATEGLVTRPCAGGRALRAVGIRDAGLDVLLEPADLVRGAVEARREPER